MDLFAFIFFGFLIFVICSMCGFCCRKKEPGAIYSTPVVITSETHQAPGQNYVVEQTTIHTSQSPNMPYSGPMYPPQNNQMPMPYPPNQPIQPYPPVNAGQAPYPMSQPSAPYPMSQQASPYPPGMNPAMMNPPSYNEVVFQPPNNQQQQPPYQKQDAFNPGYPTGQ